MTSLTRLSLCAVVAAGLLIGSATVAPDYFTAAGLDFWSLPELHEQLARGQVRQAEMSLLNASVTERIAQKERLAYELIAGRVTLFQAAARFRAVNQQHPETMQDMRKAFPGGSDEEKLCRQVIAWAQVLLTHSTPPSQREARIGQLEAELEEQLTRTGKVTLPDR